MQQQNSAPIGLSTLQRLTPSVFAEVAARNVSEKYLFIPTSNVVETLHDKGWQCYKAIENRVRLDDRQGFQKHSLRFRHNSTLAPTLVGEVIPEIVLTNSHDGSSSFQFALGFHRLVCSNGLMVPDSTLEKICVRHSGKYRSDVIDATYELLDGLPKATLQIEEMRNTKIHRDDALALASASRHLRWEEDKVDEIQPAQLLAPRRWGEKNDNAWETMNILQENIIKGGVAVGGASTRRGFRRSKAVTNIQEDQRINKAVWELTQHFMRARAAS
jgi:hypothetical protein